MKIIMKKNIQKISMAFALATLFAVFPMSAQAAFNNAPNDCPTVSVANDTTQQNAGSTCWGPSVSANPGDTVNVRIYYHNTDTNPAVAVLHLNDPVGPKLSNFNFTGFVNSGSIGSANINITSAQTLSLSHVYWYPNKSLSAQPLPNGQSAQSLFTSGSNLGSIPGWNTCPSNDGYCHSGSVVASFVVSSPVVANCSINSFTINGSQTFASIAYGASANLAWNTSNCSNVVVNGVTYTGAQAISGGVSTGALTSTQNFILSSGNQTRTVTANVGTRALDCSIDSFTINGLATSAQVAYGTSATLAWNTSNCTNVTVGGVSRPTVGGMQTLPLTSTQNFVLSATGNNGVITRTVTANVGTQNTCSISSFAINGQEVATVPYNTTAQLTWSTINCTSVKINGVTYPVAGSAVTLPLTYTQNFVLAATGANNATVTHTVTANVGTQNTCTINSFTINGLASFAQVAYGASANLAWNTLNCNTVIVNGVTYTGSQANAGGMSTGALTSTQNFTLTTNGQVRTVTANVGTSPTTCTVNSFTANGNEGSLQVVNGTIVTLAWTTSGCKTVNVAGATFTGTQAASGSVSVGSLTGSYNYTLLASDTNGSNDTRSVAVTTYGGSSNDCQITSFYANPSTVISGNSTQLTWALSNCQTRVTVSGTNLSSTTVYNNSISTNPIYGYSSYIITAYSQSGSPVTATTYVNVNGGGGGSGGQNCYINYFTANGGTDVTVNANDTANIAWSTSGCTSVSVSGPGINSNSQYGSMPSASMMTSSAIFTITASNSSYYGSNPQTQTIYVRTQQAYPYPYPVPTPVPTPVFPASVTPITTIATNIGTTSARLNALVPAVTNISSVNAYFEYGTSYSLGLQTSSQFVSTYTLVNYFDTISTVPGTTYYYRAVVNNGGVLTRGDIVSFTTPVKQVAPIYINRVNTVTYGTGTGSALASLSISNQYQTIAPGDLIFYTVTYKNVSGQALSNAMLSVMLPTGVTYRGSTQGMPTTNNTVLASLGTLEKDAEGSISIQAIADTSITAGSNLVSTATLAFATISGAQDSAVAYYMNTVNSGTNISNSNNNGLGAFAFGTGFFPTTFLGWIILIALIIIIILLARNYVGKNSKNQDHSASVHADVHH